MPRDGDDPAAGGEPLSGTGSADGIGGIGMGMDGATADAAAQHQHVGSGGSSMPPSHPSPPSAPSYIPPGQSLMTAVEWSPIVHDGKGKDTVMEKDASPPLPPYLTTAADATTEQSGDAAQGSAGLDIDQVLGLVDGLPDPTSMPEPIPVGSLAAPTGPAGSAPASASALGGTSAAPKASTGVAYPTTAGLAPSRPAASTATSGGGEESESGGRRQRRLERNRESARASRRRRKVYLEELEEKVVCLSEEMDHGRRDHVQQALGTVMQLRMDRLKEVERDLGLDLARLQIDTSTAGASHNTRRSNRSNSNNNSAAMNPALEHHVRALDTYLSRTSDELRIAEIFRKQQLLSLSLPQYRKFVLWLTIQNDVFYRGGRAASERLSAARIGERVSN